MIREGNESMLSELNEATKTRNSNRDGVIIVTRGDDLLLFDKQ